MPHGAVSNCAWNPERPLFGPLPVQYRVPEPGSHVTAGAKTGAFRVLACALSLPILIRPRSRSTRPDCTVRMVPYCTGRLSEGCLRWQKEGLEKPKAVAEATEEYVAEQDVLGAWLEIHTVEDPNGRVPPSAFYENYKPWAIAKGEYFVLSQAQFSQRLTERGFPTEKGHGGVRYFVGLGLRLRPCKAAPRD